mmetsp:Transcript_15502/g.39254  ORF Transcript_15502/g.39254 Transcript_15502/m.39254 type:complete len:190 (+) Transcript_15502:10-579(+)
MGESKKWVDFAAKHLCPGVGRISDFVFARGSGSRLFTPEGKAILDFTAGIGVTNTGHCHPTVVEAVRQQAGTITHAQVNLGLNEPLLKLTERLLGFVPQSLSRFFFWNSGAEAVEAAVKVARMHTRRPGVVSFQVPFKVGEYSLLRVLIFWSAFSALIYFPLNFSAVVMQDSAYLRYRTRMLRACCRSV